MKRWALMIAVVALLASACGSPGVPRSLVPVVPAERPVPAGVELAAEAPEGGGDAEDCGDPTASLRPSGLSIPDGSTMAKIKRRGRLVVGVDQNSNLFGFRDPATGKLEGFDIDMAREIATAMFGDPDRVQLKVLQVSERIKALQEGDVDLVIFLMTINCARREEIQFSSVYFDAGQRVLTREAAEFTGLDDLGGEKVCAPRGSTSSINVAAAESKPVLVEADTMTDCLVLLQQGQVEAISTDDTVLAGLAAQDPATKVVGSTFSSEPYGIGIPKDNEDMVRYVNAVLEDVRDGAWQESYKRWLEPALGPATPPTPSYR